jgi:hypothetical protein
LLLVFASTAILVASKGFWWWCMTFGISELLYFDQVQWLRLALSKGSNTVGVFTLTWGRKQIQCPKRSALYCSLEYRTLGRIPKPNTSYSCSTFRATRGSFFCSREMNYSYIQMQQPNVFIRSNTGIVGSNPTQGMDVYLRLLCVCVVRCR